MTRLRNTFGKLFPEAGCDEAGRGCLAGPVAAAAVILHPKTKIEDINDSKKLSHTKRLHLRDIIKRKALCWAVAFADNKEIDEINILNASVLAMHRALSKLKTKPEFIIVDGNKFIPYMDIPYISIIKGDSKYMSIAAASILAKTARDEYMQRIHNEFPQYYWNKNKGYPTMKHKIAISEAGLSPYHRRTFSSAIQLKLF